MAQPVLPADTPPRPTPDSIVTLRGATWADLRRVKRAFLGLTTGTDVAESTCQGRSYWPDTLVCEEATVRTVYCGDIWAEGDAIDVAYADGVNP